MPSRASKSPPMPNVSSSGSSFLSSRTTSDACRSPDASPATMANFTSAVPDPEPRKRRRTRYAQGILRCAQDKTSSQRERIHDPRHSDAAEEERAENEE